MALAILLGGGTDEESLRAGEQISLAVRQRQVKEYIQRVRVAGFGDRFEDGRANAMLAQYVAA
jgi:outer membrane protein OmpA-like peptidoglycan-associated protein